MIQAYLLQIILIVAGILLFLRTMRLLAKKILTETISMFWSAVSFGLVIFGVLLIPFDWNQYISSGALLIVLVGFAVVFEGMFYFGKLLSYNIRKIQELAIQISLLNQEHIKVNQYLSSLSGHSRYQIWRTDTTAETSGEEIVKMIRSEEKDSEHIA